MSSGTTRKRPRKKTRDLWLSSCQSSSRPMSSAVWMASSMIERSAIPLSVKNFNIIYELIQYVKDALTAKIPKEYVEEITGRAKLLALFSKEKDRQVVGGKVETGSIWSGNDVRIMRRETEIGSGKIRELQQQKKRVDEVREGFEFGMMLDAKVEVVAGDRIEAVRTVEKK